MASVTGSRKRAGGPEHLQGRAAAVARLAPSRATATFLAGLSAETVGDRKTAIAYYQEHTRLRPLSLVMSPLRLGDLYKDGGDAAAALESYQQAAGAGLPPSPTVDALGRAAAVQISSKNYTGPIKSYQAILDIARIPWYRATIMHRLGQAQQAAGQTETGRGDLRRRRQQYAETGSAVASLEALDALGTAVTGVNDRRPTSAR